MGNLFSASSIYKKRNKQNDVLMAELEKPLIPDYQHIFQCRINEIESNIEKIHYDIKDLNDSIKILSQNLTQIKVRNADDVCRINTTINVIHRDMEKLLNNDKHLKNDIIQVRADLRSTKEIAMNKSENMSETNI